MIKVELQEYPNVPLISQRDLDPDWKNSLSMHTSNENPVDGSWCYPTRGFNRKYAGGSPCKDLRKFGDDFPFYAGHSLNSSPYKKD